MNSGRIRKHLIKSLTDLMSDISERCWAAGWDSDVPYWNSSNEPAASEQEAKRQAEEYVAKYR